MATSPAPTPSDSEDTVRTRLPSVAEITLDAILDTLGRVEPSPREREFRARAETYRLTIANRATLPPTKTQRMVMREMVAKLHDSIVASVERGRLRPKKS